MTGAKAVEVQVTTREQADQLAQQFHALEAQGSRLQEKRTSTAAAIQRARDSRASTVESLSTTAEDKQVHIHKTIDSLDGVICEKSRVLEGLDAAIVKLDQELAGVHQQLSAAQEKAALEEQLRQDDAAQAEFSEDWKNIDAALDKLCLLLAKGVAGPAALAMQARRMNFIQWRIDQSMVRHRGRVDNDGWHPQHGVSPSLVIHVAPALPPVKS